MLLSKAIIKFDLASTKALSFVPPKFELSTPEQALNYLEEKKARGSDFRMNESIRIQTGVKDLEEAESEESIERRVLEKLKSVQENAYQEAYQLGLDQGRQEALTKNDQSIKETLEKLDTLLVSIRKLKVDLVDQNQKHLVQLAFHVAKRLAYKEVSADPSIVIKLIKEAIEMAQLEEQVTVHVNPSQLEFIEKMKLEQNREFEFLKKVKLEALSEVKVGGCVIHTNYSEIDFRIEERVTKLWAALEESFPKSHDQVKSE